MDLFEQLIGQVADAVLGPLVDRQFRCVLAAVVAADLALAYQTKSTPGLTILSLFSIKSTIVFGNCPEGRISGGRCLVSTVFYMSTSKGNRYFLAHSIGTPSSRLVLELSLTLSPSETLMGFPFESLSISVWLRVVGSMKVRC